MLRIPQDPAWSPRPHRCLVNVVQGGACVLSQHIIASPTGANGLREFLVMSEVG